MHTFSCYVRSYHFNSKKREGVLRQDISEQVTRKKEDSIEIIKIEKIICSWTQIILPFYHQYYFVLDLLGIFLNRRSIIIILMSIEILLLAVNINLVAFSNFHGNLQGQIFTMFVLTVAAAEAAIGLAIIVIFFRNRGSIKVEDAEQLKG